MPCVQLATAYDIRHLLRPQAERATGIPSNLLQVRASLMRSQPLSYTVSGRSQEFKIHHGEVCQSLSWNYWHICWLPSAAPAMRNMVKMTEGLDVALLVRKGRASSGKGESTCASQQYCGQSRV